MKQIQSKGDLKKLKYSSEHGCRPSKEKRESSSSYKYTFVRSSQSNIKLSRSHPGMGQMGRSSPDRSPDFLEDSPEEARRGGGKKRGVFTSLKRLLGGRPG
eukprot:3616335-Pyramimonas_sp.AAC.1